MITGSVQINKGYYFLVFNIYNEYGKRKPEWHSTGLKVDSNERKNNQIRKQDVTRCRCLAISVKSRDS